MQTTIFMYICTNKTNRTNIDLRMKHLPEEFVNSSIALLGRERFERLAAALDEETTVSIRLNGSKCSNVERVTADVAERVPWCPNGYYLNVRPTFTFDPLLHAGAYYVQEASSMFLHHVLSQYIHEPVAMLDLCAAPGGKTTTALDALPEGSVMVCNEPIRQRAQVLAENIQKWGNANVVVTNSYPHDIATAGLHFNVVLCDVPCSGEGMFRKDDGAVEEWSLQNVERCHLLQREIVNDAWQCLDDGGLLIYSTCTFNAKENEENVAWICNELGAELLSIDTDTSWHICGSLLPDVAAPVYRFLPGQTRGEGLFMAAMRKQSNSGNNKSEKQQYAKRKAAKTKQSAVVVDKKNVSTVAAWLTDSAAFEITTKGDNIIAIPQPLLYIYNNVEASKLKLVYAGITLGTVRGRDIIPSQSLALSTNLNRGVFPEVELTYEAAINYLRKEAITLPPSTVHGFVLTTYKGFPIGFVKNLGNRANNLYPQEWRIKSSHVPSRA